MRVCRAHGVRAAPVPRARRHRRARRRAELRRDPRAAAGQRRRRAAADRAGRGHRQQVRRSARPGGATSRRSSRRPCEASSRSADHAARARRRHAAIDGGAVAHARSRAYRELVYETPGFVDYFRASTPIARDRQLNIGSRPASRKASPRIEDLRAIPWVFSWSQCRADAAGLVRLRHRGRGVAARRRHGSARRCCARCTRAGRSSAPCSPTWTWCSPRPTSPSPRATRSWCRDAALREQIFGAHRRRMAAHARRRSRRSPAHESCSPTIPTLARSHPQPLSLPRPAEPPAGRAAAPPPRRRDRRARRARDPPHDQRPRGGVAEQRLTMSPSCHRWRSGACIAR